MFTVLMAPIPAGFTEQTQKIDPQGSRRVGLYQRFTGSAAAELFLLKQGNNSSYPDKIIQKFRPGQKETKVPTRTSISRNI